MKTCDELSSYLKINTNTEEKEIVCAQGVNKSGVGVMMNNLMGPTVDPSQPSTSKAALTANPSNISVNDNTHEVHKLKQQLEDIKDKVKLFIYFNFYWNK